MPDTAARTTSPLRPETPANLASRARSATLIGAAGLATFFAVVAITRNIFLFDLGRVAWLFSGLILLNLGLAATAPRWAPWRWAIYAYEAFQVIVLSVILYRLGGLMMGILLITYRRLQREGAGLAAEGREDLERIVRLAGGTEDMIRDLLELFRITSQPEAPAWVELGALVERALETLRPQIAAKQVRVEIGPLPRVWGQGRKLGHVVSNLLGNAVKYVAAEQGEIAVSGGAANGSVSLSVRDNGIGIPPAYHRGIFELFGRVPGREQEVDGRAVGGTGVGLAIVKRIVEAHRGSVAVESAPGAGSCFTVRLPADGGG